MDARFAIAARHSRLVRFLRVAVPMIVILSMAAVVGISIFNPFRILMKALPMEMGNLVVSGTKVTMESPHLSGYTPDQRPYELWAKTATQDLTDPDHVDLRLEVCSPELVFSRTTLSACFALQRGNDALKALNKRCFLGRAQVCISLKSALYRGNDSVQVSGVVAENLEERQPRFDRDARSFLALNGLHKLVK